MVEEYESIVNKSVREIVPRLVDKSVVVSRWIYKVKDDTSGEVVDAIIYQQLVGSLMYLVNMRPNICYAVNQLSQAMVRPTNLFWKAGKHVLGYLRGTSEYVLWYKHTNELKLHGFMDVDWAGIPIDRKKHIKGHL
jgi:hypothetical protein